MKAENIEKILNKLEAIDQRLSHLEKATSVELHKLQISIDLLAAAQDDPEEQESVLMTLQRIDAKMSAVLETQKLNFEILRVFSGDSVQH